MSRSGWTRSGVLALLVLAGAWLLGATEWVEQEVDTPPRGAALRNEFFAFEQLLLRLGVPLERRRALDSWPAAGTVLVLHSRHWDLFPERAAQLREWVVGGGHLVIPATMADDAALAQWIPVRLVRRPEAPPAARTGRPDPSCRELVASGSALAGDAASRPYRLCATPSARDLRPAEGASPQWALAGPAGTELLRLPHGQGSVTVHGPWGLLNNRQLLRGDTAAAVAAAMQLQPGTRVWLVTEEARVPLLRWIWQQGSVAVLLATGALLAWLWRGAVRFGPIGAVPAPERRSMRDQLVGTAAFLRRHGPAALHAAQVRALQEAARACLPAQAKLAPVQRVEAIARTTALDATALGRAVRDGRRTPQALAADLALLEEARRRLLRAAPTLRSTNPHAHQA
jgi:hypothetical protein